MLPASHQQAASAVSVAHLCSNSHDWCERSFAVRTCWLPSRGHMQPFFSIRYLHTYHSTYSLRIHRYLVDVTCMTFRYIPEDWQPRKFCVFPFAWTGRVMIVQSARWTVAHQKCECGRRSNVNLSCVVWLKRDNWAKMEMKGTMYHAWYTPSVRKPLVMQDDSSIASFLQLDPY